MCKRYMSWTNRSLHCVYVCTNEKLNTKIHNSIAWHAVRMLELHTVSWLTRSFKIWAPQMISFLLSSLRGNSTNEKKNPIINIPIVISNAKHWWIEFEQHKSFQSVLSNLIFICDSIIAYTNSAHAIIHFGKIWWYSVIISYHLTKNIHHNKV